MKNKKYYPILIAFFVAIIQIASGLSSLAYSEEDDVIKAAEATNQFTTSVKLEHHTTLNEKYDMFTGLFFNLIIKAPKNFVFMTGVDAKISHQKTNPNENQVKLTKAPYLNVSYNTGLKAGPLAWSNLYVQISSTTPDLYKYNSVYTSFATGTMVSFSPVDFMEIYYNISISKYVNKHENGPTGSNSSFAFGQSITVQFTILKGLKYCQSLTLSMGLNFQNTLKYSGTWIGSHGSTLSISYSVIPKFNVYAYFYSNGNNYTPVGDNNFSLYHRNTSMFAFGVGSTF